MSEKELRDGAMTADNVPPPPPPRHPLIEGLIKTLPEPGSDWPAAAQVKWLQTAANIFDLIYKGDGGITVSTANSEAAN